MSGDIAVPVLADRPREIASGRNRWIWAGTVLFALTGFAVWKLQANASERTILSLALVVAVQNDDATEAKRLLERGADANTRVGAISYSIWLRIATLLHINHAEETGNPLLLDATSRRATPNVRRYAMMVLLLAHGADPNESWFGVTPLMEAAMHDDSLAARLLLAHHADVNLRDAQGRTALVRAKSYHAGEAARLLREHGASD